jgi:cell wall-associated NlpC family hydrolase
MIASLQASGDWKTSMSELSYGDLVFTHAGHVGIYLGNGMMVHAPSPGRTVCVAPVYAFYGGGTF